MCSPDLCKIRLPSNLLERNYCPSQGESVSRTATDKVLNLSALRQACTEHNKPTRDISRVQLSSTTVTLRRTSGQTPGTKSTHDTSRVDPLPCTLTWFIEDS